MCATVPTGFCEIVVCGPRIFYRVQEHAPFKENMEILMLNESMWCTLRAGFIG